MASPIKVLKRIRIITLLLSAVGLGLSGYSVYVSTKKTSDPKYKAYCDIDDNMSCSKVFTSKYGKGFGLLGQYLGEDSPYIVSNGIYGIAFYIIVILLGEVTSLVAAHIQRILVILSNVMSVFLGYILYFVLKDLCVVCISTYAINLLLTICCFLRVSYLASAKGKKKNGSGKNNASNNKSQKAQNKNKSKGSNANKNNATNKNTGKGTNAASNNQTKGGNASGGKSQNKSSNANNKSNANTKKNK